MQELIEQMWEIAKYGDSYEVAPCIEAAEAMLEKEKEVMCEFALKYAQADRKEPCETSTQLVFDETFKTKEK